jgi:hypothetical protein
MTTMRWSSLLKSLALALSIILCPAVLSANSGNESLKLRYLRQIIRSEQMNILKTIRACILAGIPYRLGGSSPSEGMDCSGFVSWVYRRNGYAVPRDTSAQARLRRDKDNLAPGDVLVFRGSGASGYHTGIYVGKGWYAHAPGTGKKITLKRLSASARGYLGAWSPIVRLRDTSVKWALLYDRFPFLRH